DEVFSDDFLGHLRRLNEIVSHSKSPIERNLCYLHRDENYVGMPPDSPLSPRRRNFARVAQCKRTLLEVGFNAGHSALLALSANPEINYFGVDIGSNPYSEPCARYLSEFFPDRFHVLFADSREALPYLATDRRLRFDAVHVDGGASPDLFRTDMSNAIRLVGLNGHLVVNELMLFSRSSIFIEYVMT